MAYLFLINIGTKTPPNEKVTYEVIEFNQKDVTENDKKRIQWAIKLDGKQEVLKEKCEKLVLTIK